MVGVKLAGLGGVEATVFAGIRLLQTTPADMIRHGGTRPNLLWILLSFSAFAVGFLSPALPSFSIDLLTIPSVPLTLLLPNLLSIPLFPRARRCRMARLAP